MDSKQLLVINREILVIKLWQTLLNTKTKFDTKIVNKGAQEIMALFS